MDHAVAIFHEGLADLLKAGVSLSEAVATAGRTAGDVRSTEAAAWAAACARGSSLADALRATGHGGLEVALIDAGERSGRLPELCRLIAGHARRAMAARRMALTRLAYPALLVHVALIALAVPVVVPRMMAGEAVSLLWLLAGPAALWAAILTLTLAIRRSTPERRARWLRLPGVRGAREAWIAANTCTVLHAAAVAGLLVPQMLELAATASGDALVEVRCRAEARRAVAEGTALSVALGRAGVPAEVVARLAIAEKAGSLDTTLDQLAVEWHERFALRLDWLVRVATSTAYGCALALGVITVFIMAARYLSFLTGMAQEAGI